MLKMKKKKLKYICLGLSLFIQACAGSGSNFTIGNGSGNGSTVTSFVKGDGDWSVSPISGQGTTNLLLGGKTRSVTGFYPDLVVLTTTGAYLLTNKITSNALGWNQSYGRITGTEGGTSTGALLDLDLVGDSAKDQNLDLAIFLNSPKQFKIFTSNGDASFSNETPNRSFTSSVAWMSFADFADRAKDTADSTGKNRLWLAAASSSSVHSRFSVLDSTVSSGSEVNFGNSVSSAIRTLSADFDHDDDGDFILIPSTGNTFSVLTNSNDQSFTESIGSSVIPRTPTSAIYDAVLGDVDRDGYVDLILSTASGIEIFINISDSAGSIKFQERTSSVAISDEPTDAQLIVYQDFTEDSVNDLVLISASDGLRFFSGTSESGFTFNEITSTAFNTSELQSDLVQVIGLDVDRDRVPDLVMIDSAGNMDTFFNNADDSSDTDE